MQASDIPAKFTIPFANGAGGGFIRPIPTASQIGVHDGYASLTDGFVPLNFLPVSSGGVPPFGQDFNGLLFQTTAWSRWMCAGGTVLYDGAFSSAVGGYPKGSVLRSALYPNVLYQSTADNNTTDPDATTAANWVLVGRIRPTSTLTLFVRTDGNDANNGLSNTTGGALLTLQRAFDILVKNYDVSGSAIQIKFADGSYAGGQLNGLISGQTGYITIQGNAGTPANVVFTSVIANNGGLLSVESLKIQSSGDGLTCGGGTFALSSGVIFGPCSGAHIYANNGVFSIGSNYNIVGGGASHLRAYNVGKFIFGPGVATLTGTPAFSTSFVDGNISSMINLSSGGFTYSGAATGVRFVIDNLTGIFGTGANVNYFPGNAPGINVGHGAIYN